MGHYDDAYEAEYQAERITQEKRNNEIVLEIIGKMDSMEIEHLAEILKRWDDYEAFFKVINGNARITDWDKKR